MISAIILARNEEKNIADCIKCLSFCDEIIVIDDNSDDKTASIAKKLGAKIIEHTLNNDFSAQRNFAMSKAKNDWIFFVDADERVNTNLQKEIIETIKKDSNSSGYYIQRYDYMWNKLLRHGETGDLYILRLMRKNTGKWVGKVHETWISLTSTHELKNPLFHYPHINTEEFLREINFYSTLRSQELFENKIKTNRLQIFSYPLGKFLQNYLIRLGFLDGVPGLLVALLMSFHSFLVRGKLWQLWDSHEI